MGHRVNEAQENPLTLQLLIELLWTGRCQE